MQHKYSLEGFHKDFNQLGLSDAILWIIEVGGTCKTASLTALKSASKSSDHDLMKLSMGTFKLGPDICKAYYHWFLDLASV